MIGRGAWVLEAACRGKAQDTLFFPATEKQEAIAAPIAKELYCDRCPVRAQCLTSALQCRDAGVRAGTTEAMRKRMAKARSRVKCPLCEAREMVALHDISICRACGASWNT